MRFGALRKTKENADFEIDVELIVPGFDETPNIETRALVTVMTAPKSLVAKHPKLLGEAIFDLNVSQGLTDLDVSGRTFPISEAAYVAADAGYWISLSRLMKTGHCESNDRNAWGLVIPQETRSRMLVWWDQYGGELQEKKQLAYDAGYEAAEFYDLNYTEFAHEDGTPDEVARNWVEDNIDTVNHVFGTGKKIDDLAREWGLSLKTATAEVLDGFTDELAMKIRLERERRPNAAEVERQLEAAGIGFTTQRSGGADWSVRAWGLGNNLYLVDTEGGTEDGYAMFELVRRDMEREANEPNYEMEGLAEGKLANMIDMARMTSLFRRMRRSR